MPNGGPECCGTCWFNRRNRGEPHGHQADNPLPPFCEIRDLAIEDPFYTYCANHPYVRCERDPIPIGPVTRHGERGTNDDVNGEIRRPIWKLSPDSEEIRQHLLTLLESFTDKIGEDDWTPWPAALSDTMIWQLGEFREQRAVRGLERIRKHRYLREAGAVNRAFAKIRGEK